MITLKRIQTNEYNYTELFCNDTDITELNANYTGYNQGSKAYIIGTTSYYELDKTSTPEWILVE